MKSTMVMLCLLQLLLSGCGTLISKRGTDIHWYGLINAGDAERFRQKLGPDTRRLIITSAGGVAEEMIDLARTVQARGLTVEVKDYCASACAFLFLAAKERVLPNDAFLALHASPQDIAFSNLTSEQLAQLLGSSEVSNAKAQQDIHNQLGKIHEDLREIFRHAGVKDDLYEKLILLEGAVPGSVKIRPDSIRRVAEETGDSAHITTQLDWKSCGRRWWIPDQEGLTGIGVKLARPYQRPPEEKITRRMHSKVKDLLFGRIDDLTEVTCKTSSEPGMPAGQGPS